MIGGFKRSVLISCGLMLAFLVGFFLAFRFIGGKFAVQTNAITTNRTLLNQSSKAAERLAALKTAQPEADVYGRALNQLLPTQEGLLQVPREVEEIGRLHQVSALFTFSAGSTATDVGNGYASLPFSVTASGSGANLVAFLEQLEVKYPRYTMTVDNIDLTGADPASQQLLAVGKIFFKQ